mmetsp:Transcript_1540/g.2174  ORF Transcript_1540/g.2174 Transcript_1540/m.2174 type:complete len:130 (-) Transcript_1540:125-514(-)|eukprot:CAMPEP_0198136824 /NCGR_PEP_ID=MMETSP1443-20131203/410_1 /TAXON_ID=186043 /ORGANISM="Entomoneis sp., Strain CCMP2396" /LENGTH=129 /DNA_ID=CAMNT_0043798103 /DNA_START=86 /DNA_END=475 /DNA_ORIENTATION=+
MVREIQDKAEFDAVIAEAGDKLVVVDFTATWCGPCRAVAPEFQRLSEKYSDAAVIFLKVDVDKCRSVASAEQIRAMPTFKFYKKQQLYHQFMGASVAKLEQSIQTYSQPDAEPNPNAESEGSSMGCVLL